MLWRNFPCLAGGTRLYSLVCASVASWNPFGWSSPLSWVVSYLLSMHWSVLCWILERHSPLTSGVCSLCSPLCFAFYLMNLVALVSPRLSAVSLEFRASPGLCFTYRSLGHGLEIFSGQDAWVIIGFISFVYCPSDTTVIHCLTPSVLKTVVSCIVPTLISSLGNYPMGIWDINIWERWIKDTQRTFCSTFASFCESKINSK